MVRRILGALLIARALAPLVLLAVLVLSALATEAAISRAADTYRTRVRAEVESARATFQRANEGLSALGQYASAVRAAVGRVAKAVANLASSITIPVPQGFPPLPAVTLPGVPEFKQLTAAVAAAGAVVGREVDKVTALADVPEQLAEIRNATSDFTGEVRTAVLRWVRIVAAALSLGLLIWFVGSLARIADEVRRGWVLLRGLEPPADALAELTRQVTELSRQVAALQAARA